MMAARGAHPHNMVPLSLLVCLSVALALSPSAHALRVCSRRFASPAFLPSSRSFSPASLPPNLLPVLSPHLLSPTSSSPASSPPPPLPRLLSPACSPSPALPRLLSLATPSPPRFLPPAFFLHSPSSLSPSRLLLAFPPPPSFSSAVLNYRGLVWRLLDQWQSSDLTAKSSPSASVFASGNETQEETFEASQDSGGNATWGFFEQSQDSARTTWEARDVSKTTRGESTGGELAATSDAEGAESDRAVGMSRGWRKWRGHVAREERPLGQRRQMADAWLDGPCSDHAKAPVINIPTLADFSKRLSFTPVTTVILELQRNLVLSKGILFDSTFSCTILRSAKTAATPFQITHMGANEPVLRIWNTSNVLVLKVDFRLSVRSSSPSCTTVPEIYSKAQCPTISVIRSYGIQIAKGSVFGRIDLHRSSSSRVDSMRVTGIPTFDQSPGELSAPWYETATCTTSYSPASHPILPSPLLLSPPPPPSLPPPLQASTRPLSSTGDLSVSSCETTTCTTSYSRGSAAAPTRTMRATACSRRSTATSWWLQEGTDPGIRTLQGSTTVFTGSAQVRVDSGPVPFWIGSDMHFAGDCMLTQKPRKVTGSPGWSACLTPLVLNCDINPGTYWELMRKQYYDTPVFQEKYPFWPDVCGQKTVNGKPCNVKRKGTLPAEKTGACSGLPTENTLNVVLVETEGRDVGYKYCEVLPAVEEGPLNDQRQVDVTDIPAVKFLDYANDDLGVNAGSSLYSSIKDFKSCPRKDVGPRRIDDAFYFLNFNRPEPEVHKVVVSMSIKHVHDTAIVKLSKLPKKKGK
ncbi:unnamed protein product [Closterium sp. NIES-54]